MESICRKYHMPHRKKVLTRDSNIADDVMLDKCAKYGIGYVKGLWGGDEDYDLEADGFVTESWLPVSLGGDTHIDCIIPHRAVGKLLMGMSQFQIASQFWDLVPVVISVGGGLW